jgi:hypothetical protein
MGAPVRPQSKELRHRLLIGHEGIEPTAQLLTGIRFILESVARIDLLKIDLSKPLQTRNYQGRFGEIFDRNAESLENYDLFGLEALGRGLDVSEALCDLLEFRI